MFPRCDPPPRKESRMSISALSSSSLALIEQDLLATQTANTSSTASTTSAASTASATAEDPTTASTAQLTKDLAALLKDLASGDATASKTALATVQQDIKSQNSSDSSTSSTSTSSSSPLDTLLAQISSSLNSTNSTTGSLQDLAAYLIQNGQGTGNVVNTNA